MTRLPTEEHIQQAARMLFDVANPDVPDAHIQDRDQWFADTQDYWIRSARKLVDVPGTPMTVSCPCGWTISGPSEAVDSAHFRHRCEKTDPRWGSRSHADDGRVCRECGRGYGMRL